MENHHFVYPFNFIAEPIQVRSALAFAANSVGEPAAMATAEQLAREDIDQLLEAVGWRRQSSKQPTFTRVENL